MLIQNLDISLCQQIKVIRFVNVLAQFQTLYDEYNIYSCLTGAEIS